jgi:hypothetical protein
MPALENPRYEAFALAIVAGLAGKTRIDRAQSTAYLAVYPNCSEGNSAEAAASRLLRRVKPILERVREIQAQAARKAEETPEKIATELNEILAEARRDRAHGAAVSAALGKAKVLGLIRDEAASTQSQDFKQAKSMQDIGLRLLQSVGLKEPDSLSIAAAIEANDEFIAKLEAIRDKAHTLTIDE